MTELELAVLGRRISARGLPSYLVEWLRLAWGADGAPAAGGAFRIEVAGGAAGEAPARANPGRQERPGLWVGGSEPEWWFRTDHGAGALRLRAGGAALRLWPGDVEDDRSTPFYEGTFLLLGTALSASGLVPLHASAARPPAAEQAWVFMAASGTGKSTTLLRLALEGWTPVMEDYGWIDPAGGTLCGWDVGIRLGEEARKRFAHEPATAGWTAGPDGKELLSYEVFGAPAPRRAAVGRVVLLEREPGRTSGWREAHPHEAARALWESVGALLAPAARKVASRWIAAQIRGGDVRWFNLGEGGLPRPDGG